jgi:HEPN domain-containing protein
MTPMTREWVRKAEHDVKAARLIAGGPDRLYDNVCFHCQQAAEKYLKALLQESGRPVPRTHDLLMLRALLLPAYPAVVRSLRRGLEFLTQFAVDHRYPGRDATKRQAEAAVRWTDRVRIACRTILGLPPS